MSDIRHNLILFLKAEVNWLVCSFVYAMLAFGKIVKALPIITKLTMHGLKKYKKLPSIPKMRIQTYVLLIVLKYSKNMYVPVFLYICIFFLYIVFCVLQSILKKKILFNKSYNIFNLFVLQISSNEILSLNHQVITKLQGIVNF